MISKKLGQLAVMALAVASVLALGGAMSRAQETSRTFAETGKTVSGRFLEYWNTHGGLAQQGYPISEVMQEVSDTDGKSYTVQYFERAVFERHPENTAPNDVLLSLLGVFAYSGKYPAPQGSPNQTASREAGARPFPQTGKMVGGLFLKYWNEHGGLAQQGYPISDEFSEVSDLNGKPYKVQYFERAVFEYHPENKAPYDVLLSQLGTLRYRQKYAAGSGGTPPATSTRITATAIPGADTYTPEPPTNTPKPTREATAQPTMCPALGNPGMSCADGHFSVRVTWNAPGGAGQVEGTLTFEEDTGQTQTSHVGRSGNVTFFPAPACGGLGGNVLTTVTLELHDECGQSVSSECSTMLQREPCP